MFLSLVLGSMAAFTFAHVRFFGREALFNFFLLGLMFPSATAIIPLFLRIRDLGLLDSYFGVALPQVAFGLPMSILLFRKFFRDIPVELYEAATMDGAGYARLFFAITLPLSRPILATVAIISFVGSWNNYLLPLIMLNESSRYPWPLGIMNYMTRLCRRLADDPGVHHADDPADGHRVCFCAETHRGWTDRGCGKGLAVSFNRLADRPTYVNQSTNMASSSDR